MIRLLLAAVAAATSLAASRADRGRAAELDVRLRFAWGSGAQAPQAWAGSISAASATVSGLQPLGLEADEAAALQLVDNQVVIAPLMPRAFDSCDLSIRGDEAAVVTIRLQKSASAEAKEVRMPLGRLAAEPLRTPLDDLGGYLLVQRSPGDVLRVQIDRDHLVFGPGESMRMTVEPHLLGQSATERLTLDAQVVSVGTGAVAWESSQAIEPETNAPVVLELAAPAAEDAYRMILTVRRADAGFGSRLTPWQRPAPVATRDVEFVVVDPQAPLPRLGDAWELVQTIDPAQPKWWQQVAPWTQLDRLPVLSAPRTLGNVKPTILSGPAGPLVELPAPGPGVESSWRAYPLSIPATGQPYAVEIELSANSAQQLAASIIEPDAAGRALAFGREAGAYVERAAAQRPGAAQNILRHRVTFWPRTSAPVLLVANHSPSLPARFGTIRVWRRPTQPATAADIGSSTRLVAAYISTPRLAATMGAAEQLDAASGLSVQGWRTFLEGGRRLAMELRAGGFNAAIVGIAADGSSLTALDDWGTSPKYDSGPLAASGADARRKDVLETLLRIFDREGLKLIPAIELGAPVPHLETLRRRGDPQAIGVEPIAFDGRTWSDHFPGQAIGARYNLLSPEVQAALTAAIARLVKRYGHHPSLGGVALQLNGRGYGVLPGLGWGMDDATTLRFAADTQVTLPAAGTDRFKRRAEMLTGPERTRWTAWREAELTRFYAELASTIAVEDGRRQLVLCTENLFAGAEAGKALRQALSGRGSFDEAAAELGVDLKALADAPGVCLLRPRRLASDEDLETRALELLVNSSAEFDDAVADQPVAGELLFHGSRRLRLPSFDAQSPWGAEKTFLSTSVPAFSTDAAARGALATALGARDFETLVEGAELLPMVHDAELARMRRLFQELPGQSAEVRVQRSQPVTMRVYRADEATTVCLVNESAWAVEVQAPLENPGPAAWQDLGGAAAADSEGTLPSGASSWKASLPPYGIVARRFASRSIRVGTIVVKPAAEARAELAARIEEIDQRLQGLDGQRPYEQLQNPGFELTGPDDLMLGWLPRLKAGAVTIDAAVAARGARSLHLVSADDDVGVAAQSQLFPIPSTGQLTVGAIIRTSPVADNTRMYVWIEHDLGPAIRRDWRELKIHSAAGTWAPYQVTFDDLPLGGGGQMRVNFHLAGPGEAWVDGVELFDLQFAVSQQVEFARQLCGARIALEDGLLVDCQRLVDGYWPRYLVESLPASGPSTVGPADGVPPREVRVATQPDAPAASDEAPGLGNRLRQIVPKKLR